MAKQFKSWWDFHTFCSSVRHKSRFVHDRAVGNFLSTLHETSKDRHRRVSAGKYVWRAQLGNAVRVLTQDDIEYDDPVPYAAGRMKPLPYSAHEGRVNPKGIPCLYVANDKETAMSEVRPTMASTISVAQLRLNRDLTLIDFSIGHADKGTPLFLDEPEPEERAKAIWMQVDRAFSQPVVSDFATAEYVPTQVISEFFKKKGFDGVVYKSQLGPGFNIALFDLNSAEVANCALHSVRTISLEFKDEERRYSIKQK